jgi:post-segregation antitoxin (ccd killing protein)
MTNTKIPKDLTDKAHALGVNVSGVCRRCLVQEIRRIEKEAGVIAAKQSTPVGTSTDGGQDAISS